MLALELCSLLPEKVTSNEIIFVIMRVHITLTVEPENVDFRSYSIEGCSRLRK